jgi:hypothetical protein
VSGCAAVSEMIPTGLGFRGSCAIKKKNSNDKRHSDVSTSVATDDAHRYYG